MNAINVEIQGNNLRFYLNPEANYEDYRDLLFKASELSEERFLQEVLEPYYTNGRFYVFHAALVDQPLVAEDGEYDDEGHFKASGRTWHYRWHHTRSWFTELIQHRQVFFTRVN